MRRLILWFRLRLIEIDIGEMRAQQQRIRRDLKDAEAKEIAMAIELLGLNDKRNTA